MIPADRFLLDGDTAWLVIHAWPLPRSDEFGHDRPCKTCDGTGSETMDSMLAVGVPGGQYPIGPCPAYCIDGRHTFDIGVEGPIVERLGHADHYNTYRVSIVPGMVLPILGEDDPPPHPPGPAYIRLNRSGRSFHLSPYTSTEITLPSAAAPGMWAVKLKVAS